MNNNFMCAYCMRQFQDVSEEIEVKCPNCKEGYGVNEHKMFTEGDRKKYKAVILQHCRIVKVPMSEVPHPLNLLSGN